MAGMTCYVSNFYVKEVESEKICKDVAGTCYSIGESQGAGRHAGVGMLWAITHKFYEENGVEKVVMSLKKCYR